MSKNKILNNYLILLTSGFLIEVIFRLINNLNILNFSFLRTFVGINVISIILSLIYSILPRKISYVFSSITVLIFSIYSFAQMLFLNFLGVYMSFNTVSQAGAVKDYIMDFLKSCKPIFLTLFLPFILLMLVYIINGIRLKTKPKDFHLKKKYRYEYQIVSCILLIVLCLSSIFYYHSLSDKYNDKYQVLSLKELFEGTSNPSLAVKDFGIISYGLLDLKSKYIETNLDKNDVIAYNPDKDKRDIDDTTWENIITNETDSTLNSLNSFYINNKVTSKNEYTGKYAGKNLIVIMMESVNDIIINEDYFPNFYKLLSSSYYFENNYSPRNSCATGNNEFSAMTSLYSIYNNCTSNLYVNNTYPESIFNLFNNKGYYTFSAHDYTEHYYYRNEIHTNMGSRAYYGVDKLGIEYSNIYKNWASDEEFMEKVLGLIDGVENEHFMTWLTTVSSHQPYYYSSIEGDKYLSLYDNLDIRTDLKRYKSKLKILDNALGILLDGLEERGILDDTVIVMYGDHYPYGLSTDTINTVLDYDTNVDYENERVPFVIYNSEIKSKTYKEYTSYINILPTIANLFDLEYDPRLYMGTDLLSKDYNSMVVFADGSWKNEYAYYNASRASIEYYTDKTYTIEELKEINNNIDTKIKMSSLAIKNNYFNYLNNSLNGIHYVKNKEINEKNNKES